MPNFQHDLLDVYQVGLDFLGLADEVAVSLPTGRGYLTDQLRRAASSIVLNTAEGAGEFAWADKARFYRIARRSATECAAILDCCAKLRLGSPERMTAGRELLLRIVAMLTAMVLKLRSGAGSGSRAGSG